jgi:hypothetical protein
MATGQVLPFGVQQEVQSQIDLYFTQRAASVFEMILKRIDPNEAKEIMTIDETCNFLECTVPTINKYVKEGMKKHKSGQKVYYLRKEVVEFIASLPGDEEEE